MYNSERYYIINKMYAGSYLDENDSRNIGHEAINLFSDDNGDNYIYVNKSGTIPAEFDGKVEVVILTKQYSKGCQEVLGIAIVDKQMIMKSRTDKTVDEQIAEYEDVIRYDNHTIKNIFEDNFYRGERDDSHDITFKTKRFYKPIKQLLLADITSDLEPTVDNSKDYVLRRLPNYTFGRQSLRLYISNQGKTSEAFQALNAIINDETILKEEKPGKVNLKNWRERTSDDTISYLNAMNKMNSENIYSNLIAFFLNADRSLLKNFCKDMLQVNINANEARIERERLHTDIWIEDSESIVVIENKINSGLNGKDGNQLQVYKDKTEEIADGKKHTHYYIFAPNHNRLIITTDNQVCGFKMIRYSELFTFFTKWVNRIIVTDENNNYSKKINLYFEDFVRAIKAHSKDSDSTYKDAMERLFYKRLIQLSAKSK